MSSIIPLIIIVYLSFEYIFPFTNFAKPIKINADEIRVIIFLTLLSSLLGFYFSLEIIKRINKLAERSKIVERFKPADETEIPESIEYKREDELGIISANLEILVGQIRKQFERLNYLVSEVEYSRYALQESTEKLLTLSIFDDVTGLFSSNYIYLRLEDEIKRASRFSYKFSFVIGSIDNINKCFPEGEKDLLETALKNLGEILSEHSRDVDIIGRTGHNKIALITPQIFGNELFDILCKTYNEFKNIYSSYFERGLSLSFGCATYPNSGKTKDELIDKALEML
ncbi:MAG: GGDEF domain-containing protein, partial [bacterium]